MSLLAIHEVAHTSIFSTGKICLTIYFAHDIQNSTLIAKKLSSHCSTTLRYTGLFNKFSVVYVLYESLVAKNK